MMDISNRSRIQKDGRSPRAVWLFSLLANAVL